MRVRFPLGGTGSNNSRSIALKNAASVFPDPVGARSSADSPRAMTGQAISWARVGALNERSNHSRVAGWNASKAPLPMLREYRSTLLMVH